MFRMKVMVVDRTRTGFLKEGEGFYLKRLKRYGTLEWIEIRPVKITKGKTRAEIMETEGRAILKALLPRDYNIALDPSGESMRSEDLAGFLEHRTGIGQGQPVFIIGGPLGLSPAVFKRAQKVLSLSPFTLTHEMARLVLLEQLYRAMTIIQGEPYHK